MMKRACLLSLLSIAAAVTMSSCGGGGGSAPITVNITTDVSNIETFQTVQFAAAVTGTSNTAVTWQLTCDTLPVSVCGTMSASGMYVAPNTVPTLATVNSTDPATLTVTATSQANMNIASIVQFTIDSLNMQPLTAPVQLGSSGSNVDAICLTPAPGFCFGGTLGSLVTGGGKTYILSNNHVLGLSDGGAVGQGVTQPGVIETNCSTAGTITVANVSNIISLQNATDPGISRGRHHRADHLRTSGPERQYFGIGRAQHRERSPGAAARSACVRFGHRCDCRPIVGEEWAHHRPYLRERRSHRCVYGRQRGVFRGLRDRHFLHRHL